MSEPTNNKHPEAVVVKKGKIDMAKKPWGWTGKPDDMDAPKPGEEAMDLGDVDNENESNYNEHAVSREKRQWHNMDFDKAHDDFELIKDSKKKPHAGE